MLIRFSVALALATAFISTYSHAQSHTNPLAARLPVSIRFAETAANSPPGSCGCFLLTGGAIDTALPVARSLSAAVELSGNHTSNVPGTQRGLSTLSLMAGPRYSLALTRSQKHKVFVQALFGATRGFDANFQAGGPGGDTATVFTYHLGAAYEWGVTPLITIRAAQVALVQTNLPNGTDNRQRNVQFGTGLVFHIPSGLLQR